MANRDRYGKTYPYTHDFDVENPMFCPDLSGQLQHHDQDCRECDGTGIDPDCLEDTVEPPFDLFGSQPPEIEICRYCDNGKRRWGSWYAEDRGLCGTCGAENALVAAMYSDSGDYDSQYVCLACYVRHHKEECGCDLWEWAEKILVLFMPSD